MATISDYGKAYNAAKAKGDKAGMAAAHAGAEKERAKQGYSGGTDGSKKISLSSSSKKSSSGSSGFSTPYGGYATPQEYVEAIKRVEASGGNFQNKAAADAFKAANPGYFNNDPVVPAYEKPINDIYGAMEKAQLAQIQAAKDKALGQLKLQKQSIVPQYNQLRGQADATNVQNAQRLREVMAANGLAQSGENVTGTIALQNARQNSLNDLNLQQQSRLNEVDQSMADVRNSNDEAAVIAQIEAEKARALYDAANRAQDVTREDERWKTQFDRSVLESDRGYNYQVGRDKVADEQHAAEFAEDVRRYGLEYALQQAQFKLSQQNSANDNARGWASLNASNQEREYQRTQDSLTNATKKYNDAINNIDSFYVSKDPMSGAAKVNTNGLRAYILSLGLTDDQTTSLLRRYGV